jgi:hypothetical protein
MRGRRIRAVQEKEAQEKINLNSARRGGRREKPDKPP